MQGEAVSFLVSLAILAIAWSRAAPGVLSSTQWIFVALLPTSLSMLLVQEKYLLALYKRVFQQLVAKDLDDDDDPKKSAGAKAIASARAELLKSLTDRWPARRQPANKTLSRKSSMPSNSSELVAGAGKSLYDQLRDNLTDHMFNNGDAPIYFIHPATGLFLKVNAMHKLEFTATPDASCLFHVVKGKTHHWGFHSNIYQRYVGQNLVGKMVVSSKKMSSWESFRVLQRPDADEDKTSQCSSTIYLILCSARFGKGMWVAKTQRTSSSGSSSSKESKLSVYLSKNFTNALALQYTSDLSAFNYLTQDQQDDTMTDRSSVSSTSSVNSPVSRGARALSLQASLGPELRTPVLASSERARVLLPWIEDSTSKKFFELPEKQLQEVVCTTVARFGTKNFAEFFIDQDARRTCHEKTSQHPTGPASSSGLPPRPDRKMSEWHLHPHFGYVRKLCYRPPADSAASTTDPVKSTAIDQYHSCIVDDKAQHRVVFRSKLYTLSIPYSNCVSIETVIEAHDLCDNTALYGITPTVPVMQFKCKTGVYFSRKTMFASQIEKGALHGVRRTCDKLLELTKQARVKGSGPTPPGSVSRPRLKFPPHTMAIEVIKGMMSCIAFEHGRIHSTMPSFAMTLPWKQPGSVSVDELPETMGSVYFFEAERNEFTSVIEEQLDPKMTSTLFYEALLSDECSFFHRPRPSGNMDVDIGAWTCMAVPVPVGQPPRTYRVRKQLFKMPVSGISGVDVAAIEDYQYCVMSKDNKTLEYGMKVYARDLPDGNDFSIEVFASVEQYEEKEATATRLGVWAAIAKDKTSQVSISAHIKNGSQRGIKDVWKRVAHAMNDATHVSKHQRLFHGTTLALEDIKHRLQSDSKLPTHDELSSRIIEAIAATY